MGKNLLIAGFVVLAILGAGCVSNTTNAPGTETTQATESTLPVEPVSTTQTMPAKPAQPTQTTAARMTTTTAPVSPVEPSTGESSSVVEGNNRFAIDLYRDLTKDPANAGKNLFFSPFSISTALAMTYEGARGQTAQEMSAALHLPEDDDARRNGYSEEMAWLNRADKDYQLSTANALWAQKDFAFRPEYFDVVGRYYGGAVTNLDFQDDAEGSRNTINSWVEDKTNDRIKGLIPPGALTPLTRLVLTNAIYFKGDWVKQFDKGNTEEKDFRVTPDKTTKAQMMGMEGKDVKFQYAETGDLQALEMPYSGDELSMLILLPKKDGLDAVESTLTPEGIRDIRNSLRTTSLSVYMPKYKLETKSFLAENLIRMGMPTAFSMKADFSGMDGKTDLYIDKVIHQAYVELNEEGTEAAAATAVIIALKSSAYEEPPKLFLADHPFIFIIQQKKTGNILFMGRLTNPMA